MKKRPVIIDTGPLVAFLSEHDDYHYWVIQQLVDIQYPLITCEAVITEAGFLLKKRTTQKPAMSSCSKKEGKDLNKISQIDRMHRITFSIDVV